MSMKDVEDPVVEVSTDGAEPMVVWRDSDVRDDNVGQGELKRDISESSTCNADSLEFNNKFRPEVDEGSLSFRSMNVRSLFGRQIDGGGGSAGTNLLDSIGSTDGCPSTRKVALVGIVTDCNYFAAYNDTDLVKKQIISIVNKASEVYESTFKISLAIRNLTVIDKVCTGTVQVNTPWNVGCSDQTTINDRLNTFSQWRGNSKDDNAYWTLFTTCATQTAVGLAWRGMLCRSGAGGNTDGSGHNETVAATNVVVKADTEWQIFAHETGHTFGAVHDCVSSTCPVGSTQQGCCPLNKNTCDAGSKYIMNPSTGTGITQFSPCSIGNICSGLKSNVVKGNCLTDNKNVATDVGIGSQCGNGIVEAGEDCDCGGDSGCKGNPCCDAKTCKFTSGSVCDPSNEDCCTKECKFSSQGTVCRASTGECDVAESCPGDKAACPEDKHKNDGDSCGSDGLQCASGQCTSRDLQCQHMANSLNGHNNTKACQTSDCLLACTSPDLGPNQCMTYNQYFVDGTSCGGGGKCSAGECKGTSTAKEIENWIQNNKAIFIPIVSVVGLLVLLGLISCISSSIKRRMRRRKAAKKPGMNGWPSSSPDQNNQWSNQPMWEGAAPPPIPQQQRLRNQDGQWSQSPGVYDQQEGYQYPYPPPPSANRRGASMRYA